ncbi:cytochrome P450 [Aspergillus ellipticus CBS 707.79]|uniref:Cytochrome P450 n=1 Tax=Aspergillus ellipticus CBS 707.79 TaxID=1448320 RepID=A0A319CTL8_9EURO|nr:cytochrome P450 [Aspergillus ellipticus CBS 707.79]
MDFLAYAGCLGLAGAALLWWYFHVPSSIPRDIPRIPLYVCLLSIWWNLGHPEVYNRWIRQPLEKHGAVVVWFTGHWCILVTHPDYLTDLFRNDEVYPKIGINIRAPEGVLGAFSGDNIINTGHANWGTFTSIMKPGILQRFDLGRIQQKASRLTERLLQAQKESGPRTGILIMPWLARLTQDVMSLCLFGFDLQALDEPRVPYLQLMGEIIPALFNRWFLYFPVLEKVGKFLPSRRRAFQKIDEFDRLLDGIVATTAQAAEKQPKLVSHSLKRALDAGEISYSQYRSNLRMTFMVGHDNTEFLLTSAMWELGRNPMAQDRLRTEVLDATRSNPGLDTLQNLPYLTAVIYEVLRLYPPVAEMINHTSSRATLLGGKIPIQPGTNLGWNAYGVHTNPALWGPDAGVFRPERWGLDLKAIQTHVRRQTMKGHFIAFGLHARKCLGQALGLSEAKVTLSELVQRIRWTVDPGYQLQIGGPMLTFPVGLKVIMEELGSAELQEAAPLDLPFSIMY